MSRDLATLSTFLPSRLHHDSWIAALTDRVRAEAPARRPVVVTKPRDGGAVFPGEVSVLGAPEPVAEVAAQLRAAFAPAGLTVH